jgi:hypothetical protein
MAADTDILVKETVTSSEAGPSRSPQRFRRRPKVFAGAAVAVVCGVIVTIAVGLLAGGDDADVSTPQPANRAALAHQAEQYVESLAARAASVATPERANRAALEHQVEQYVDWLAARAAAASTDGP